MPPRSRSRSPAPRRSTPTKSTKITSKPTSSSSFSPQLVYAINYFGSCAVYTLAGPFLILLNNRILHEHAFPYPIMLTALGPAFAAATAYLLLGIGAIKFTKPELLTSRRFRYASAWPIGALSALTLALGNASYVHLSVATCQMLKAFTPAITLMLLFALRIDFPTMAEMACVVAITIGTVMTSWGGEIALPAVGLVLQLGANFAEAARIVLSQQLLSERRLPMLEMQYHVAPPQLAALLISSFILELDTPSERQKALDAMLAAPWPFVAAGVLGLGLQVAGLLAVKIADSVAVKLLGVARGAALVLFEAATMPDTAPSPIQLCGYGTSLTSFVVYTWLRLRVAPSSSPIKKRKKA